ncbi:MAG: ribonuclease III [bacterium]
MSRAAKTPTRTKIFSTRLSTLLGKELLTSQTFQQAVRHRSKGGEHNERLEFLGDSILGFVISTQLYQQMPNASEGYLSRLRASLVNENSLADIAVDLGIGEHLLLGPGELKSGGHRRKSILADAVEAIIASLYLEKDIDAAQAFILTIYKERLRDLPSEHELKDPKSRLQELLQAYNYELPLYELVAVIGADHKQTFTTRCDIPALNISIEGTARSRKKAEQIAAELAYQALVKQFASIK